MISFVTFDSSVFSHVLNNLPQHEKPKLPATNSLLLNSSTDYNFLVVSISTILLPKLLWVRNAYDSIAWHRSACSCRLQTTKWKLKLETMQQTTWMMPYPLGNRNEYWIVGNFWSTSNKTKQNSMCLVSNNTFFTCQGKTSWMKWTISTLFHQGFSVK